MKAMDGVELARRLREDNSTLQLIFITGYPDFIGEGYEVSALHYLIKPVAEEKLFAVLDGQLKTLQTEPS
jgi:two-component SAPR family response regulator